MGAYMLNQIADYFDALYLFESTGSLLYDKAFVEEKLDPGIVAGFFSAIRTFAEKMISDSQIQEISFHDRKFVFNTLLNGRLILMAVVKDNLTEEGKSILSQLASKLNEAITTRQVEDNVALKTFIDDYINSALETKDERKQRSTVGESALKPLRSEKSKHVKLKSDEHRILELCDGEHTIREIADATGTPYLQVLRTIIKFQKDGLVNNIGFI